MNPTKIVKSILSGLGFFLVLILAIVFWCYILFPWDKIQDTALTYFERNTGLSIQVKSIKAHILQNISVIAKNVLVFPSPSSREEKNAIKIPEFQISASLLSLIFRQPYIEFKSKALNGSIDGDLTLGKKTQEVGLKLNAIDVTGLVKLMKSLSQKSESIPSQANLESPKGELSGKITLNGNLQPILAMGQGLNTGNPLLDAMMGLNHVKDGNITLNWKNVYLPRIPIQIGISTPTLEVSGINCQLKLKGNLLTIETLSIGGIDQDVDAKILGKIDLKNSVFQDLSLRFKFSDKIKKDPNIDLLTKLLEKNKGLDDYYTMTLNGPIGGGMMGGGFF